MRLMFATVKTAVVVTLFVSSCTAFETSSPDDVMKTREASASSTSLRRETTSSVETRSDEERAPPFVEKIEEFFDMKNFGFDPEMLKHSPEFNYLDTAGYRSLDEKMHVKYENDPFGMLLTRMRRMFGDVAVVKMIIRSASFPETKKEAQCLNKVLFRQYFDEERSPEAVCDRFEIMKSDDVNDAFNGPLFETWVRFVIYRAHRAAGLPRHSAFILFDQKMRIERLLKIVEALTSVYLHGDDTSRMVAGLTRELIVKEVYEDAANFNFIVREQNKGLQPDKTADSNAFKSMYEVLTRKYADEPVKTHVLQLRKVHDKQYEEIKVKGLLELRELP